MRPAALILAIFSIMTLAFAATANAQIRGRGGQSMFVNPGADAPPGVSGIVSDADTGRPIAQFRIIPARVPYATNRPVSFDPESAVNCQDGKYDLRGPARIPSGTGGLFIRVEAEGYVPEVSRMFGIRPTGIEQAVWDVKLRKAVDVAGIIKLASGQPASGAQVVLCSYEFPANLENGKVISALRNSTADKDGRFSIAPDRPGFSLLFLHDEGMAIVKDQDLPADGAIQLHPWGKVAGVARSAPDAPTANVLIGLKADVYNPMLFSALYETRTDAQGRFQFDRVPAPQRFLIGQLQSSIFGAPTSVQMTGGPAIQTTPGHLTVFDIGGKGRSITGRIVFPDELRGGRVNGNKLQFWTVPVTLNRPFGFDAMDWRRQQEVDEALMSEPAYRSHLESRRVYPMTVAANGTFHAEDVEPGNYTAQPLLILPVGARGAATRRYARINFSVPANADGQGSRTLDLGTIRAEPDTGGRGGR